MKLKTKMCIDGVYSSPIGTDEDMCDDSAAAHALMMAIGEFRNAPLDSSLTFPEDAINWLESRASELMAQWGFDSGEDA